MIFTMAIRMLGELCIITYPVKILLEVLSKTALERVSIARHLHEIDVSFYGNEKNHGFNEECFKIFSYLSSIKPNVISLHKQQNPQERIIVVHSYPSQSLFRPVIIRYFPLRVLLRLGSIASRTIG